MKKKYFILAMLVIFVSFVLAFAPITTFSNLLTEEILNFTGNENITRNITIPKNSIVTSAVMNLSGRDYVWGYTGDFFDVTSSGNFHSSGITQNGTYFWIADYNDNGFYKYWMNGTYTGDFYGGTIINPGGMTNNNTFIWITDVSLDAVFKFYMNGTYTGESFSSSQSEIPIGITQNGTYFWIVDKGSLEVYKYWMNGTYTGESFSSDNGGNIQAGGITTDNQFFWIIGEDDEKVYKYFMNGTYTGEIFNTVSRNGEQTGITQNGTYFWITDNLHEKVYKHYDLNTYPDSLYIQINNTNIWSHTGEFNSTFSPNKTDDFAGVLNFALNNGSCDCTGCYLGVDYCNISIIFHSDTPGGLEYSDINITGTANFSRDVSQLVNLNDSQDRDASLIRKPTQDFSVGGIVNRITSLFRKVTQLIKFFQLERIYDFTGTVLSRAVNNTVSNQPPSSYAPAGETEINYSKINVSDDDYATDISQTDNPYHKFEMVIEETDINYIDVLWEGYTSSDGNASLYVWNYTLSDWSFLANGTGTTDFNLTARIYDLNNVRQGTGNVTFLVQD